MRPFPLAILILVSLLAFAAASDHDLRHQDCGSTVLDLIEDVEHGEAYPGETMRFTMVYEVLSPITGGVVHATAARLVDGYYEDVQTYVFPFCGVQGKPQGCSATEGAQITYDIPVTVPGDWLPGKYRIHTLINGDDGTNWSCVDIYAKILNPYAKVLPQ